MMESKLGDADSVIVTGSNLKNQAEKAAQKNPGCIVKLFTDSETCSWLATF